MLCFCPGSVASSILKNEGPFSLRQHHFDLTVVCLGPRDRARERKMESVRLQSDEYKSKSPSETQMQRSGDEGERGGGRLKRGRREERQSSGGSHYHFPTSVAV